MGNNILSIKLITPAMVFLFSVNLIMALGVGVSSPYHNNNPLYMYPGQIKEVTFTLSVNPNEKTEQALVSMIENAGIAELTSGTEYTVIPGSTNAKVIIKVSVPETATIGHIYNIKFSVKSAPSEGEGAVQLTQNVENNFPVKVIEKPQNTTDEQILIQNDVKEFNTTWIIGLIVVLAIAIIGSFLIKKKKR